MYVERIIKRFGENFRCGSFPREGKEAVFRQLLERVKPQNALEIGTFYGVASAIISDYADKVYTIDIIQYTQQVPIWQLLDVTDKIIPFVTINVGKKILCSNLNYDFAFIDGGHSYEDIKLDWEIIKCNRILIDDYHRDFPDVMKFIDELRNLKDWKAEKLGNTSLVYFERLQ